jgi:hypothetical protein
MSRFGIGGSGDVKILTPEAVRYVVGRVGGIRESLHVRDWNAVSERVVVGYVPQNDIMPRNDLP